MQFQIRTASHFADNSRWGRLPAAPAPAPPADPSRLRLARRSARTHRFFVDITMSPLTARFLPQPSLVIPSRRRGISASTLLPFRAVPICHSEPLLFVIPSRSEEARLDPRFLAAAQNDIHPGMTP